ncbi:unnamed protein product [Calypogeia fissa]
MALLKAISSSCAFLGAAKCAKFPQLGRDLTVQQRGPWVRVVQCRGGSSSVGSSANVVVTRESGKNGKLIKALGAKGVQCLELPLIEHSAGPDLDKLSHTLRDVEFEWIVVTSPEGATVFLEGWRDAGCPTVRVAVVGLGTGQEFEKAKDGKEALQLEFSPSKATGKVLAVELPMTENGNRRILYPSSAKAGSDLESGLSERGFEVTRLNTYSTETVKDLDQDKAAAAMVAPVVTFASPTAVKAWVEHMGQWNGAAACIGITSAQAARKAGLDKVFYPESPGIEGWVDSVMEALGSHVPNESVV